jgi:hypothetical protein
MVGGEFSDKPKSFIEVAAQTDYPGAMNHGLSQLAAGDFAVGDDHGAGHSGASGVSGSARCGVAGGGANNSGRAVTHGSGNRAGHAAVLERTGWVRSLNLQPCLDTEALTQLAGIQQRR